MMGQAKPWKASAIAKQATTNIISARNCSTARGMLGRRLLGFWRRSAGTLAETGIDNPAPRADAVTFGLADEDPVAQ